MGASYHQFCPVAKAMELLDERWTLLVVRELLAGSQRFNELRRGLPQMSPGLLSKRLRQLVAAGLVVKGDAPGGASYQLTRAGRELEPIVGEIAAWGVRWIGEIGDQDLDPKLLMWDLHRRVDRTVMRQQRTVLGFDFDDVDARRRHWFLVITEDEVDICDHDPGFEVSLRIATSLRTMIRIWRGDISWGDAIRMAAMTVEGPAAVRRLLPDLFVLPAGQWRADAGVEPVGTG